VFIQLSCSASSCTFPSCITLILLKRAIVLHGLGPSSAEKGTCLFSSWAVRITWSAYAGDSVSQFANLMNENVETIWHEANILLQLNDSKLQTASHGTYCPQLMLPPAAASVEYQIVSKGYE
jgi:hypothetical protein